MSGCVGIDDVCASSNQAILSMIFETLSEPEIVAAGLCKIFFGPGKQIDNYTARRSETKKERKF